MTATQKLIEQLLAERVRQDAKWGVQNHPFVFPGSQRDPEEYRKQAEFWKSLNDHRVRKQTERGIPADRNCAWDGIALEEINEALAEERPGLQYAETLQATAVLFTMMDKLDRDSREDSGHAIWCPALDENAIVTQIECCTCKEPGIALGTPGAATQTLDNVNWKV